MKNTFILSIYLIVIFTSNVAIGGQFNSVLNIGDAMPEFTDLPTTGDEALSSNDLDESVIVLVSLANHCPWVRGMDEDLVELVASFKDQNVRVIGLSVNHREDDQLPAMKEHAQKYGYNFTYAYDESQELGRELGASRTPEYFVFNKERKLIYTGALYDSPAKMSSDGSVKYINGEPSQFFVRDAIQSTLENNEVAVKETRAYGCSVKYVQ